MDNEAPKYASWMPEAGGYVANGKVVSKSPIYDEQGKLKLDVDASQFPNTQPQAQPSQNTQSANNPITNNGITTANTTGSGTDVNSLVTNIGSMASTNNNTATTGGVLTSPAMTSPNTNLKPSQISGKTMDDLLADFAWFQGENNLQGMINTLTQMSALDGQDRSAQITELQGAREQKIMSMDDQYLASYNQARVAYDQAQRAYGQAVASGDTEAAKQAQAQVEQAQAVMDQIQAQQQEWRNSVGYQDAMTSAYNREIQNNRIEYETAYMNSINNQIVPTLMQLVDGFLNFQYDPSTDMNLQRAQGYTYATMMEKFANTGMYNSTATQYAVTQACQELIPVYEKMAKEEKLQQIQLLQTTASFLLNLEEAQFDMWSSQIQLQFEANQEKRRQWAQAVESSNARGYVTNEEAAILGVEPGSLSQQAREHEQELQEQLDAEARALEQKKILAEFNKNMAIQEYEGKQLIDKKYGVGDFKSTSSGGDSLSGITIKVKSKDASGNDIEYTVPVEYYNEYTNFFNGNGGSTPIKDLQDEEGNWDKTKVKRYIYDTVRNMPVEEQDGAIIDLVYDYAFADIDEYSQGFEDKNTGKSIKAVTNAYNDLNNFATWVEDTDLSSDSKLFAIGLATDRLVDRINQTEYIPEVKTKILQSLVETMDKSNNTTMQTVADNYSQYRKSNVKGSKNTNNKPTMSTSSTNEVKDSTGKTRVYVDVKSLPSWQQFSYSYLDVAGKKNYAKGLGYQYDEQKDRMFYYK